MKDKIERGCSFILALSMCFSLSSCRLNKNVNKEIEEYEIYDEYFDDYMTKDIVEDKVVSKYRFENIVIGINKKTKEVSRYIYYHGDADNYLYSNIMINQTPGVLTQLFNLDNGKLIYSHNSGDSDLTIGYDNFNKLLSENDFYFIWNLSEDLMNEIYEKYEYKTWYSKDEINEIASMIINRNERIKKLELNNK